MTEKTYSPGKCDYSGTGRNNCKAIIRWIWDNGNFAMEGEIISHGGKVIAEHQIVDEIAKFFPEDKQIQQMKEVWERYHLNDHIPGSPKQMEWIRSHEDEIKKFMEEHEVNYFKAASRLLEQERLNPDKSYVYYGQPYTFGHAWLKEEIPKPIQKQIESWKSEDKVAKEEAKATKEQIKKGVVNHDIPDINESHESDIDLPDISSELEDTTSPEEPKEPNESVKSEGPKMPNRPFIPKDKPAKKVVRRPSKPSGQD